jgi:hypothetical protein
MPYCIIHPLKVIVPPGHHIAVEDLASVEVLVKSLPVPKCTWIPINTSCIIIYILVPVLHLQQWPLQSNSVRLRRPPFVGSTVGKA